MRASFSKAPTLKTLVSEWSRLYALSDARFFLSPAWIETWLANLPAGVEVGCVRVFDDLRGAYGLALVGTAPRRFFAAPREARLHETGDDAFDAIYVEYNDILLAKDAPDGAREAAIEAIIDALPKIDEFVFRNARPRLAQAVGEVARRRKFVARTLLSQPTFEIDIQAGGRGSVFNGFSPSLRAKVRRSIRRYEERGEVKLTRAESEAERGVAWTALMRRHAETWSRRGEPGVFSEKSFLQFHQSLIERCPSSIDLARLTAGEHTIGVLYNFIAGDRVCNYQSGFRYEADNQLAPGFVCHALAAERYREDGFRYYDLMGGDAEYKRRLGRKGETLATIVLTRPGLHGAARVVGEAITRLGAEGKRQT